MDDNINEIEELENKAGGELHCLAGSSYFTNNLQTFMHMMMELASLAPLFGVTTIAVAPKHVDVPEPGWNIDVIMDGRVAGVQALVKMIINTSTNASFGMEDFQKKAKEELERVRAEVEKEGGNDTNKTYPSTPA